MYTASERENPRNKLLEYDLVFVTVNTGPDPQLHQCNDSKIPSCDVCSYREMTQDN